ncbi:MAG TPA: hypothetical protein VKP65_23780 [Rhodothermales bacterium]|nr:hypothetical protein [Rhodothermales bacterium]
MRYQRLVAVFFFPVLFLVLAETCPTEEEEGPSIDDTLQFDGFSNTKDSDPLTVDDPSQSYRAEVEITSEDAIDTSDVDAYIIINCSFSEDRFLEIPLRESGLTRLVGSATANGSGCVGIGGQNERVTFYVRVVRRTSTIQFSVRVNGRIQ